MIDLFKGGQYESPSFYSGQYGGQYAVSMWSVCGQYEMNMLLVRPVLS